MELEQMLVDIASGTPPPADLTAEERAKWSKLKEQVQEIKDRGGQIDIPSDGPAIATS